MTKQQALILTALGGLLLAVSAFLPRVTASGFGSDKILDVGAGWVILIGGATMLVLALAASVKTEALAPLVYISRIAPLAALWVAWGAFSDKSDFSEQVPGIDFGLGVGIYIAVVGGAIAFGGVMLTQSKLGDEQRTEQPLIVPEPVRGDDRSNWEAAQQEQTP
ncbi:MAG: hypothetical protein ACC652_01990 [Acidimicrobiales bacterium]